MHILGISQGEGLDPLRWAAVLRCGLDAFLIREKQMEARALLEAVRYCQDQAPGVELWVAGRLDVALAAGCGLHAPEAYPDLDPAVCKLSRPLHAEAQWEPRHACAQLLVAPVFESPGKEAPWGTARLHRFLDQVPAHGPRLLALGGVEPSTAPALKHPRLDGVALIRALWTDEPAGVVEALRNGWR